MGPPDRPCLWHPSWSGDRRLVAAGRGGPRGSGSWWRDGNGARGRRGVAAGTDTASRGSACPRGHALRTAGGLAVWIPVTGGPLCVTDGESRGNLGLEGRVTTRDATVVNPLG